MLHYSMQDVLSIVCFHHGLSVDPLGGLQPVVQLESTSEVINRWSTQLPPQGMSAETPGPAVQCGLSATVHSSAPLLAN